MSKLYTIWTMFVCIVIPTVVAGQFTAIPDSNFEQALIDLGIDSDGEINGTVATADISPIETLDVSSRNIQNLQGLEDFSSLEVLFGQQNKIQNLSVRDNFELRVLRMSDNLIGEINLSDNVKLEELYVDDNLLGTLNVRSNVDLKILDCSSNQLQRINVTDNFLLERLDFSSNGITEIDLFENPYLAYLDISDNPLQFIILFNLIRLKEFHAEGNDLLTRIDFDQTHALEYISCHDNENLAVIEVRGTLAMKYLNCSNNQLAELDLSQNEFLESLYCHNNKISSLDLSLNEKIAFVHCNDNQLTELNLKNGQNALMTGGQTEFEGETLYMEGLDATDNSELECIQVDNSGDATAGTSPYDSWLKDDFASYSEDCQSPLDVTEYELDRSVRLLPNPVEDRIHIESSSLSITRVTVYSVLGNTLKDFFTDFHHLEVMDLKPGIYYVRVNLENGAVVKKMIKI